MPDAMNCPLCGRQLRPDNDFDPKHGRFHCPDCFATATEAQRGWLPPIERPVFKKEKAEGFTRVMGSDPSFAIDRKGDTITRQQKCECGQSFEQRLLSERFLRMVEKASRRAVELLGQQIPGYYVPVHCPRCERIDLGRRATIDQHRQDYPQPYEVAADD